MSSPIRLSLTVDSPSSASITGIEELAKRMDASFQLGAQRSAAAVDAMANRMATSFGRVEAILDRIALKAGRLGGGGRGTPGVAGGAVGGVGAVLPNLSAAQQHVESFLAFGGFERTGSRFGGVGGQNVTDVFKNAAGQVASVNRATLALRATIPDAKTAWVQFTEAVGSGSSKIKGALGGVRNFFVGISGIIYTTRNLWRGFDNVIVSPIEAFSKKLVQATEDSRKFEIAISGVVGGAASARSFNRALTIGSADSPFTVDQLRTGARTLGLTPYLSGALAGPGGVANTQSLTGLAQKLSMVGTETSPDEAFLAIKQLVEGGSAGAPLLRRKFGLSTGVLAGREGISESRLKSDPALLLRAVEHFADDYIPNQAIQDTGKLVSVRMQKLQDAVNLAFTKIGDSKVFDALGERLGKVTHDLFEHFKSPKFDIQAAAISTDLDRIIGNVGKSIEAFLRKFSGSNADTSTVSGVVQLLGDAIRRLADISERLPGAADKLGIAAGFIATKTGDFIDAVVKIADIAKNPLDFAAATAGAITKKAISGPGNVSPLSALADNASSYIGDKTLAHSAISTILGMGAAAGKAYLGPPGPSYGADFGDFGRGIGATTRPSMAPTTQTIAIPRAYRPNYDALLGDFHATINAFSAGAEKELTPYDVLQQNARASISKVTYGSTVGGGAGSKIIGDVFDRIEAEARKELSTATDTSATRSHIERVINDQMDALSGMSDQFGEALKKSIKELPPEAQVFLYNNIKDATSIIGNEAKATMLKGAGLLGKFEMKRLPGQSNADNLLQRILESPGSQKANEALINSYGRYGNVPGLASVSEINSATPLSDRAVANLQIGQLDKIRPQIEKDYRDAIASGDKVLALRAKFNLEELDAQVRDFRLEVDDLTKSWMKFAAAGRGAIEGSVSQALDDIIWKAGSAKDVLVGLAHSVTKAFSDMASSNIVQAIMGDAGKPNKNGQMSGFGGIIGAIIKGFGGGGDFASSGGSAAAGGGDFSMAANGAVWPGFTPIHAFSAGGVVRRPTMGIVGEGRYPEAVIPMPNGRSVGVELRGGGDPDPPNFYVVNDYSQLWMKGFRAHKDYVYDAVAGQMVSGKKLAKIVKRRPG